MLQYKSKIPSNIAQTWTIGEKPKQTLPEHSRRGLGGQAVKVKKANGGCLDNLGDKGGISVREGLGLSSTLRARLFDGDSDGNPTFG
jgi:hypothetical protein